MKISWPRPQDFINLNRTRKGTERKAKSISNDTLSNAQRLFFMLLLQCSMFFAQNTNERVYVALELLFEICFWRRKRLSTRGKRLFCMR